ncbi:hypothetical protein SLEP1_g36682 [Rubroshorea leprosula]|uniref:Chaperone DnaJ C-terminal domain-containing protein n=1 Tax=Rubroshorea leprosula TaxID=152421 RepID=A0AAV5KS73_9ROSI|nr:hypothetical protein SLEP1_g36682 [Rubroshorea leprosula]
MLVRKCSISLFSLEKAYIFSLPTQNHVLCFLAGIKSRNSYSFGDQYVHFNVSIPTNLTTRQRELIEEFAKEEQGEIEKHAAAGATG